MVAVPVDPHPIGELEDLAGELESLDIGPALPALESLRAELAVVLRQYLIPRAMDPSAPLIVVFMGPTGSGKSTLVNSLTGQQLSRAGSLRPTTRGPVALVGDGRTSERLDGIDCELSIGSAPVLDSMVLVDTPDLDSTETSHREAAEALADRADVVVFVTSALRYADDVPWQVLRRARARGGVVIPVINRVTPATAGAVIDFRSHLVAAGLDEKLLRVPEHHLPPAAQSLPRSAVRSLTRRLVTAALDREKQAGSTWRRVLDVTLLRTSELVGEVDAAAADQDALAAEVSLSLADRVSRLDLRPGSTSARLEPVAPLARRRVEERLAGMEERVADVVVALVAGDLRLWWASQRLALGVGDAGDGFATTLSPAIRAAVEGWIGLARRIVAESGPRRAPRAEAELIGRVLAGTPLGPVDAVGATEVELLANDLRSRLEVVYAQAGSQALELVRDAGGDLECGALRIALGRVATSLTLVDA